MYQCEFINFVIINFINFKCPSITWFIRNTFPAIKNGQLIYMSMAKDNIYSKDQLLESIIKNQVIIIFKNVLYIYLPSVSINAAPVMLK